MKKQKYNVAVIGCGEISGLHIKGVLTKEQCVPCNSRIRKDR